MTIIGNSSSPTLTTLTSATNTSSGKVSSASNTNDAGTTQPVHDDTGQISSRAKSIQKINEEFFSGGTIQLNEAFIERLEEYQLISSAEAKAVLALPYFSESTIAEDASAAPQDNVANLSVSVESLIESLQKSDPDSEFLAPLQRGQDILDSLESYPPTDKSKTQGVIEQLEIQLKEGTADITDAQKKTIEELTLTLQVADKLSGNDISTHKLNAYLDIYHERY